MDFDKIEKRIDTSLNILKSCDKHLLERNTSERSIAFRIGMYLAYSFKEYDVDCEYNGLWEDPDKSKFISILTSVLVKLNKELKDDEVEKDYVDRNVFPDIIIHHRDKKDNLLVIEIKKLSMSKAIKTLREYQFDKEKIRCYTDKKKNRLKYKYGLFLQIPVGKEYNNGHEIKKTWFKDGEALNDSDSLGRPEATRV